MRFNISLYAGALSALLSQTNALNPFESIGSAPGSWAVSSTPKASQPITLQVALTQQNLEQLESTLLSVSMPGSSKYGQHLSQEAVQTMFAPSSADEAAVLKWLKAAGITKVKSDGDMVVFTTTVATANKLLSTEFLYYELDGVTKLRTTKYSVPEAVAPAIDFIDPTVYFGRVKPQKAVDMIRKTMATRTVADPPSKRRVAGPCKKSITPSCLKQLYNATAYQPIANSGSRIAFGSFLNQSARHADLFFYEQFNNIPQQDFINIFVNTAVNNQSKDSPNIGEANLDVQNIIGVSHPLPVTQYLTGGSPPFFPDATEPTQDFNEPYLPYYKFLLAQSQADLPQVITNSYGDDETTVPPKYATRVCNHIGMLGLRGITVFESSGDEGIGASCLNARGGKAAFTAIFPATCPYVTSVGGTQSILPEIAWSGSSGGFSAYFARPSWQDNAINTYLTRFIKKSTLEYYSPYFNQSGRGFPDVSAHSLLPDFQVVYGGRLSPSGGTSAASPVWAALAGMINDALLRNGKPVLGFLNPFLYTVGVAGLTDITAGQSIGCNGVDDQNGEKLSPSKIIPYAFWNATFAWDPVTGLGTPNLGRLIDIALAQ